MVDDSVGRIENSMNGAEPATENGASGKKSGPKGLARIKAVRKIVDSIIKRSRLEITELHIFQPDAKGVCAKGRIRLSHLGTGPLPLVALQIKFKDQDGVSLRWCSDEGDATGSDTPHVRAHIDPIQLQQGTPGSAQSEVGLQLFVDDAMRPAFVEFVRRVLRADPKTGVAMQLDATGVQVKAYGIRFGGLSLNKEVFLGGLGSLNGALAFDSTDLQSSLSTSSQQKSSRLKIDDLDIIGGDAQRGIRVTASVTITNPAEKPKLSVEPGDLRFALCVYDKDAYEADDAPGDVPCGYVRLGNITLAAVALHPGANTVKATGYLLLPPQSTSQPMTPKPSFANCAHAAGQSFMARILQNERVKVSVLATRYDAAVSGSGVSDVGWLAAAFEGTRIDAQIPPLGDRVRLLDGAEVRVEDRQEERAPTRSSSATTQSQLHGAVARTTLRNSFGADIIVHNLSVKACSNPLVGDDGRKEVLELGTLTSPDDDWNGLVLKHGDATHVSLPMQINPDAKVLIELLRKSAATKDVNLGHPFTQLLDELRASHWTEAGFEKPPQSRPASTHGGTSRASSSEHERSSSSIRRSGEKLHRHSLEQRADEPSNDLADMLAKALANLRVTAHVEAAVSIGDFDLPGILRFEQRDLPIALSTATAASLLPLVGQPFVKALVDRAEVDLCAVELKHLHDKGIDADLALRLTNFGPLSAQVTFIEGLQLRELVDNATESRGRTLAVIHFTEPLAVIAGDDDAVMIGAQIVPPAGPNGTTCFRQFISNVLQKDDTTYHAVADTISVVSGGVQFQTAFAKSITVDGLGGLPDLRLDNLEILGDANAPANGVSLSVAAPARSGGPGAIEIEATTQMTNRGNLHLRLQKLELSLSYESVDVGQASIDDVDIQAYRTSTMGVKGLLYAASGQKSISDAALEKLSKMIQKLFRGDEVVVKVHGRRGWVHPNRGGQGEGIFDARGQTQMKRRDSEVAVSLAWLDEALRDFTTTAKLQWKDGVQLVKRVEVGHIQATFPARKPMQLKIDSVTAAYQVPFPIAFNIISVGADIEVLYKKHVIAKCQAVQESIEQLEEDKAHEKAHDSSHDSDGFVSPKPRRKQIQGSSGKVELSLKTFELLTQEDSDNLFGDMMADVFQSGPEGTAQMMLRGDARVKAKTSLGVIEISVPLGIEQRLELQGLNGLRHSPLKYDSLEITGATSSYVELTLNAQSHNPSSSLTVNVPDSSISLAAYYNNAFVGDVVIGANAKGVTLAPGAISLPNCAFRYHPTTQSEPKGHLMLSDLFEGRSANLSIRGHKRSSVSPALAQALALFDLPITIAPLGSGNILERIKVTLGLNVVTSNSIDARYTLNNPTKLELDVLRLEVNAFYQSNPFGSAVKTFSKEGKEMPIVMREALDSEEGPGTQSPSKLMKDAQGQGSNSSPGKARFSGMERLRIPAGAKSFEGAIVVKLQQPLDQLVLAFLHERGNIVLDVELVAKLDINGYDLPRLVYHQKNVPLEVAGLKGVARLLRLV